MERTCSILIAVSLVVTSARGQTPVSGAKHTDAVTTVACSPDGKQIVSGGADKAVRVWDAATAKEVRQFAGHGNRVTTVAFTADAKSVVSSSADGSICVWDMGSGLQRLTMRGHRGAVRAIALSNDGRSLASGGEDFRLFVWDMSNGQLTRVFQGHRAGLTALAYSPDAKLLASCGGDSIKLWEVTTARELRQFTANQEGLRGLAFAPDAKTLAAAGKDGIYVWETDTGKQLHKITGHKAAVTSVAFAADGKVLASAGEDGAILLWDPTSGKHLRVVGRHRGAVNAIAFAPTGKHLVSGGEDHAVMIWDVSRRIAVPENAVELSAKDLDALWGDLAGADNSKAFTAMGTLVAGAKHALPFLQQRLKSLPPSDDEKKIARHIRELDDDNFAVREQASAELEKLGQAAAVALKLAITGDLSLEARRRAERVLERLKAPVLSPEQLRLQRAIEVLSTIDTPEARKLLEDLSRGKPSDWLTVEAKSALELLNKRAN